MRVAIYARELKDDALPVASELLGHLSNAGIEIAVYERLNAKLQENLAGLDSLTVIPESLPLDDSFDYVFTLGGDGTILDTINLLRENPVPIVGINLGRLGFLAGIQVDEVETCVQAILKGNYEIDERTLLEFSSNEELFGPEVLALNEFSIQRRESSSMINVKAYLNGEMLTTYWSDGLIVSTATGSTGYSLSCGGPIIHPSSDNFVLTPIASHNLNVRPVVVSSDIVLSFEVEGRENVFLSTLDTRTRRFSSSCQIAVKKAKVRAKLLRLNDRTFINALKDKLLWGVDQRN